MSVLSQFGGGAIKQIQRGQAWINPGVYSNIFNISPVVMAKTELRYLGGTEIGSNGAGNNVYPGAYRGYIYLHAADAIGFYRFADGGGAWTFAWELTEYY